MFFIFSYVVDKPDHRGTRTNQRSYNTYYDNHKLRFTLSSYFPHSTTSSDAGSPYEDHTLKGTASSRIDGIGPLYHVLVRKSIIHFVYANCYDTHQVLGFQLSHFAIGNILPIFLKKGNIFPVFILRQKSIYSLLFSIPHIK